MTKGYGFRKQAGDTIVEVLFAVAVVGLAIAISYGIASRSLRSAQQAQERGQALKLAESQLESMKAIASGEDDSAKNALFAMGGNKVFCVSGALAIVSFTGEGWGATIKDRSVDDLSGYEEACVHGLYHIAVQREQGNTSAKRQFTAVVRWYRLGTDQLDEVKLVYRLHL